MNACTCKRPTPDETGRCFECDGECGPVPSFLPPWLYWCAQTCPVEESEALRLIVDNNKKV